MGLNGHWRYFYYPYLVTIGTIPEGLNVGRKQKSSVKVPQERNNKMNDKTKI